MGRIVFIAENNMKSLQHNWVIVAGLARFACWIVGDNPTSVLFV